MKTQDDDPQGPLRGLRFWVSPPYEPQKPRPGFRFRLGTLRTRPTADAFPQAFTAAFHRELATCFLPGDAALVYAWAGVRVFPCGIDKRPLTQHGYKDASVDDEAIRLWWDRCRKAMIGIPTGKGFWVLDLDGEEGEASLAALVAEHGEIPATWIVATPRHGRHLYFATPDNGVAPRNSAGILGKGIDVRGQGGYVIVPPSVNAEKRRYTVVDQSPVAPAPKWLLTAAMAACGIAGGTGAEPGRIVPRVPPCSENAPCGDLHPYVAAALEAEMALLANMPPYPSRRNDQLFKSVFNVAGFVAAGHLSAGELRRRAEEAFRVCHPDDFDGREFEATFASAMRRGMERPRDIPVSGISSGKGA